MISRRLFLSGMAGASFTLALRSATAQSYPAAPVKIITAGLPGTPFDIVARAIADKLSRESQADRLSWKHVQALPAMSEPSSSPRLPPMATRCSWRSTRRSRSIRASTRNCRSIRSRTSRSFRSQRAAATCWSCIRPFRSIRWPSSSPTRSGSPSPTPMVATVRPGHLCMEYFRLVAGFQTMPVPYRGNPQLVTDLVAGSDQVRLRGDGRRCAARPCGAIERPCGIDPQALSVRAGPADDCGERISRFRIR